MTTILGIDAAWTATEPSGAALVQQQGTRLRCIAAAASYASFIGQARGHPTDWTRAAVGCAPDSGRLLHAATELAGERPTLVTLDMPVSDEAREFKPQYELHVWLYRESPAAGMFMPFNSGASCSTQAKG